MSIQTRANREPILPEEHEIDVLRQLVELLAGERGSSATVVTSTGHRVALPGSAFAALVEAASILSGGQGVALEPVQRRLTPEQAAAILNVPTSYLLKLLDEAAVPSSGTGADRRVALIDLILYKRARDEHRRETLDELSRLNEELDLYTTCP